MRKNSLLRDNRLYGIFGITLIGVMGVASIAPALPQIAKSLHLSQSQIALMISAFTLPGIFLTPVAGIVADRLGRKKVIVPSLFVFAFAGFAIFFVKDFQTIVALRVFQGIGAAPLGSLNTTLIGDFYKGKQRPTAMGYNASVLSMCTASYPLIGGALAGIAWFYPFAMPLLALPVGLYLIFSMPEPEIEKPIAFKHYLKAISQNILKKEVIAVFTLGTLTFIILYGAFLTYIPFLLDQKFNFDSPQIGMMLSLSSVATAVIATQVGKLTARFGSIRLLRTAFVLYTLVVLILPNVNTIYMFLLPIIIFGTAQALNIPSLQTTVANLSPDNQRGIFMSMNGMVLRIGQTLGPMVIGIGYAFGGIRGAFYLSAAVGLVGLVILFTLLKPRAIKEPSSNS